MKRKCLEFIKKFFFTIIGFGRCLKHSKNIKLPQNENEEIYILGNGPSVKEKMIEDEEAFSGKTLICMNYMVKADFYEKLKPRYYILCDPALFVENVSDYLKKERNELLHLMIQKTRWEMYLMLPFQAKKSNRIYEKAENDNKNIKILYFNSNFFNGFDCIKFRIWEMNRGMPGLFNVVIAALVLAINMGYRNIYLLGVESSWFKFFESSQENLLYMLDGHCYDKGNGVKRVLYSDSEGKVPINIHEELYNCYCCFKEYHEIQKYAKFRGVNVFNVTPNSFIDAFPKVY